MHRDQGGKGGGSGPRQRSAAGHEAWLLSGNAISRGWRSSIRIKLILECSNSGNWSRGLTFCI